MDYSKLIITDENGKTTINENELKAILQKEGDYRATQASQTARLNAEQELREKIRQELEEEAKLSAEERARNLISKEMEGIKKEKLNLNRDKIETMFIKANIDKEDYEDLLGYVSDDYSKSVEVAEKQISSIKKIVEKQLQSKLQENMSNNATPPMSGNNGNTNKTKLTRTF